MPEARKQYSLSDPIFSYLFDLGPLILKTFKNTQQNKCFQNRAVDRLFKGASFKEELK